MKSLKRYRRFTDPLFPKSERLTPHERVLLRSLDAPDFERYGECLDYCCHKPKTVKRGHDLSGGWHNVVKEIER